MRVANFGKRGNSVGTQIIDGGTLTKSDGVRNEIGMTTTTKVTAITMMTVADALD
jgi:hypothetical protein